MLLQSDRIKCVVEIFLPYKFVKLKTRENLALYGSNKPSCIARLFIVI